MLSEVSRPLTFLRFGIQRKKEFLRDLKDAYDGLVLPGNILLYQYRATPAAVFMCERPFFVDPMSYLFGQPYESFKQRVKKGPRFKPSFHKLMDGHGLTPSDFLTTDYTALLRFLTRSGQNLATFTDNALAFQQNNVWDSLQEAKDLMTDEQREKLQEHLFRPSILIPPYFLYTNEPSGRSITNPLNTKILDYCWSEREKWPDMFPMVFVSKGSLQTTFLDEVTAMVRKHNFPGYCVWVEDFDEREATQSQVVGLIKLTRALSAGGKQVVMLYGGFFSMLLYYFGLGCVCHGLAYGEARAITASAQQGSGPAPIRYYVFELHSFLTLPNALSVLRERPDLLCSCPVCQRVLRGNPENVTRFEDEDELAEIHFLWNRKQERTMIENTPLSGLIQHLDWARDLNEDLTKITKRYRVNQGYEDRPIIDPSYIGAWAGALKAQSVQE